MNQGDLCAELLRSPWVRNGCDRIDNGLSLLYYLGWEALRRVVILSHTPGIPTVVHILPTLVYPPWCTCLPVPHPVVHMPPCTVPSGAHATPCGIPSGAHSTPCGIPRCVLCASSLSSGVYYAPHRSPPVCPERHCRSPPGRGTPCCICLLPTLPGTPSLAPCRTGCQRSTDRGGCTRPWAQSWE